MPRSREEEISRNTSMFHFLLLNYLLLRCGWRVIKFTISWFLTLQMLHTKFGQDWTSSYWEDVITRRTTHDDRGSFTLAWQCKPYCENALFLEKYLDLYSEAWVRQTLYILINNVQRTVYQNCKFHDPQSRGFCARAWSYKSCSENALFL